MNHKDIRNIRIANGIPQKDFAELIGVPVGTWSNVENGRQPLYAERKAVAVQALKDLGCDFNVLEQGIDFPTKTYVRQFTKPLQEVVEEAPKQELVDAVNHPSHYADRKYEVIDIMQDALTKEEFCGYLEGNVIKYIMRYKKKGNPRQDLEKAKWYLNKLIEQQGEK